MDLKRDDWVKTDSDEVGRVLHIGRFKVIVMFTKEGFGDQIETYQESQLTKIEGPGSASLDAQP